jgi:glycosyltransferase involved in cell wall biosynthesis
MLLDAFAEIRRQIPEARLRFVGEPPSAAADDGVEIAGPVASVAEHVRQASLLLLPSLQEGFGIVAAEALAAGVPVVTTPSGGPEDLIRDSGGGRVLGGFSADEFAAVVVDLLHHEAALADMRRRGREYVAAEHSPARFAERLGVLFEELDG